ncbi:hypothetical protein, partial [Wolbachia endosymbiont of Pentidionis agamae]|uniref:hypothetical protein n=1 Tax=Wolbachia endosymbiont of Pentidionis agamae TaxID=3110435 RepID=UPI002FD2D136
SILEYTISSLIYLYINSLKLGDIVNDRIINNDPNLTFPKLFQKSLVVFLNGQRESQKEVNFIAGRVILSQLSNTSVTKGTSKSQDR